MTSPTFTLVHKYDHGARVYHVDLYRIGDSHDLETLGLGGCVVRAGGGDCRVAGEAFIAHGLARGADSISSMLRRIRAGLKFETMLEFSPGPRASYDGGSRAHNLESGVHVNRVARDSAA